MKSIECMDPFAKRMLDYYKHLCEITIDKKILLEKYFNEHQGKILICMIVAVLAMTILSDAYDSRDEEEKLIAFGEYQNYKVDKVEIPTEGDVVLLKKLPFGNYEIKNLDNGSVIIAGNFYYEIRPQTKFAPDLCHSDNFGNTPENSNYWGDIRYGTVLLSVNEH